MLVMEKNRHKVSRPMISDNLTKGGSAARKIEGALFSEPSFFVPK